MRTRFEIEGLDDLDDNLARAAELMSDPAVVMPVLLEALEPVAQTAKGIVHVRTGRLRDGISVSDRAEGAESERGIAAYVGPSADADYAIDVEVGRPPSVGATGREYDATRAYPYMRPAWNQNSDGILPATADGLGKVLARELKG